MRNKATFRQAPGGSDQQDRPAGTSQSSRHLGTGNSQRPKPVEDDADANRADRMLRNDEIREICETRGLTRMDVYNIRSQFAGMCLMSKEDEQRDLAAARAEQEGGRGKGGKGVGAKNAKGD